MAFQRFGIAGIAALGACLAATGMARAQGGQAITLPDGQIQHIAPAGQSPARAVSAARYTTSAPAALPADLPAAARTWPGLVQAAGIYALYRDDVRRAAGTPPVSAEDLERVMTRLASYDGARLSRAFHAHAVLLAMQSPAFAAGVRQWGNTYDRRVLIANLRSNPAYAVRIPGYRQGVARVLQAAREDAENLRLAGGIYKDLAYSLQHARWASRVRRGKALLMAEVHHAAANAPLPPSALLDRVQRDYDQALRPPAMAMVQTASARAPAGAMIAPLLRGIGPGPARAAQPDDALAAGPALTLAPSHALYVQDIMASAAVHLLARAVPSSASLPQPRGADSFAECVDWARMHLNQCAAATHFVYEDSFCIAEHQLKDTASCLADFAVSP